MSRKIDVLEFGKEAMSSSLEGKHFKTSLRRLVFGMRLIGIPLDSSGIRNKLLRYWTLAFGFVSFVVNTCLNVTSLIMIEPPQTTAKWNYLINEVNFAVAMVLVHAGLLTTTAVKWKDVSSILDRIEELNVFEAEDYKKFEKMCLTGGIALLIPCAVALAVSLFCTFYPEHAGGFILPMKIAFTCYFFVCGIVFSLLVRIVSVMLNIMTKRVGDRGFTHVQIARLQRCYLFVGNLVNAISSAFGFALLVILAFVFIWTVNGSFMAYVELNEPGPKSRIYSEMAMLITTLISYTFTVYAPDKIKQEATEFANQLRSLHSDSVTLEDKAYKLMVEVSLSPLQVVLMGVLDVDLRLVPTLVGTTLTYIIIMVQFRTSEIHTGYAN